MTDVKTQPALKIGDVARQAELSIDAIRFYEREGLLGRVRPPCDGARLLARRGEEPADLARFGAHAVRAGSRASAYQARRHRSANRRAATDARCPRAPRACLR